MVDILESLRLKQAFMETFKLGLSIIIFLICRERLIIGLHESV